MTRLSNITNYENVRVILYLVTSKDQIYSNRSTFIILGGLAQQLTLTAGFLLIPQEKHFLTHELFNMTMLYASC
jgi:hypothetical protein